MRPKPQQIAIYTGLALAAVGFLLIGLSWDRAAGLDCVQCQFPYLISGGLTGIGLIIVGTGMILIQVLRQDGAERDAQLEQLTGLVEGLNKRLSPPDEYDPEVIGEFRPRPRTDSTNGSKPEPATASGGSWEQPS